MKKIIFFAAAAFAASSLFAFDLGDLKGTWQDSKWNADWTFTGDGKIILSDSTSGEEVFTFTDANVQDFKINAGKSGLTVSFKCSETERSYKFTKPVSLNADLDMHIDPEWTDEDYDVKIKFKKNF